jgi:hypothetical protein
MTISQPCDLMSTEIPRAAQYRLIASTKIRWLLIIVEIATFEQQLSAASSLIPAS